MGGERHLPPSLSPIPPVGPQPAFVVPPSGGGQRQKVTYVGAPACFALSLACQQFNRAFGGFGCYLVGSALERPDWRDIDVRLIMSDDEFEAEFPGTLYENRKDGGTWEMDPKWLILTTAVAGWLREQTGLPVDFQFQPQTHANTRHKGPRSALGLYYSKSEDAAQ